MSQKQLEKEVIRRIIIEEGGKELDVLLKQLSKIKVKGREFTGHGFFTEFIVPNKVVKCKKKLFVLGERIYSTIEEFKDGKAGFVLFIRDWKMDTLEGYFIGNGVWNETTVNKFKVGVHGKDK